RTHTASAQRHSVGEELSVVVGRLDDAQASVAVPQFLEALGKTTASSEQRYALSQGLSVLVGRLDAAQASTVLPQFLEVLGKTTPSGQLGPLGQGLTELSGNPDPPHSSP